MFMNPDAPQAPPPIVPHPNGQGQYDFIFNGQPPKKSLLPGQNSKTARILLVAGGGVALVLIAVVVISLLSGSGGATTAVLTNIAKQQNELIRISEIGDKKARSSEAQNLAATTKLSLKSDQASLLASMGRKKPSVKILAEGQKPTTDQLLTQAEQSNRFDEVFIQTVQTQLAAYRQSVKKAYDETSDNKTKQLLAGQYKHALTLAPQ